MSKETLLFSEWLEELAEQYGDKPAITCGTTLSYRQLLHASRRCALALADAGVQKGDTVMLWAYNSVDWVAAFFGIAMAGGAAALVNYSLNPVEVTNLTRFAGAKWAVIGDNRVSLRDPAAAAKAVVDGGVPAENVLTLKDAVQDVCDDSPLDLDRLRALSARVQPGDTQCIIFTSGTTSLPKGVQLSSGALLSTAWIRSRFHGEDLTDSCCVALPAFHSFGLVGILFRMCRGIHIYLVAKIKPELVLDLIADKKIETLTTVGSICSAMTELPGFEERLRGVLKFCVLGGGFTSPAEMARIEDLLDGKVLMGYGLSECSSVISCSISADPRERRVVTVGHILPGIDVAFWQEGKGFLPTGEIGELFIKCPGAMNGYLGLPAEQQPIDADGWMHTGDLARITEDGLLMLAGRLKDIIVRKGENISPLEVETALLKEPSVREVKVMGAPHPTWGESVEACVVYYGEAPDEQALRDSLSKRLARYKIPSHFFAYSSFPLNANGKLDQRSLKESMLEKLHALEK